jgi:dTDP-4-dehydrorhamnose reductase
MKILVLGSQGQVGWELVRSLLPLGEVVALTRAEADLAQPDMLRAVVRSHQPELIVNAAAYTAVDKAESEEALAFAINATAPGVLSEEAKRCGALLIHYSTDYVFDGTLDRPYVETDQPNPQNVYGRSKLAGEQAIAAAGADHLILRTSWVYGARGHNFMKTILRLAAEREVLRIVADQTGAPTWSRWIADATSHIARSALQRMRDGEFSSGIYHLTSSGSTTWHGFAEAIVRDCLVFHHEPQLRVREIQPIATSDYPLPAKRPSNSRLDCAALHQDFGVASPDWQLTLSLSLQ